GFSRHRFGNGSVQPVQAMMMRCQHNQVGAVLFDVTKHALDWIGAMPDDLGNVDAKLRDCGSWATCRQEVPTRQGLSHCWKCCPLNFILIANMDEHKFAPGNERCLQRMRECDQTGFREIRRMKYCADVRRRCRRRI